MSIFEKNQFDFSKPVKNVKKVHWLVKLAKRLRGSLYEKYDKMTLARSYFLDYPPSVGVLFTL